MGEQTTTRCGYGGMLGAAMVALCLSAAPSAVAAQSLESVEVELSAEVPTRCGFAMSAFVFTAGADLEVAHSQSFRLGVDCNAPYAVVAHAANGRLVHQGSGPDGSGYAFTKSYGLQLVLETDKGPVRSERCVSETLAPGATGCALTGPQGLASGEGVSIGRDAVLTIDWSDQSTEERRLAAGDYSDTIILEIGARA